MKYFVDYTGIWPGAYKDIDEVFERITGGDEVIVRGSKRQEYVIEEDENKPNILAHLEKILSNK